MATFVSIICSSHSRGASDVVAVPPKKGKGTKEKEKNTPQWTAWIAHQRDLADPHDQVAAWSWSTDSWGRTWWSQWQSADAGPSGAWPAADDEPNLSGTEQINAGGGIEQVQAQVGLSAEPSAVPSTAGTEQVNAGGRH